MTPRLPGPVAALFLLTACEPVSFEERTHPFPPQADDRFPYLNLIGGEVADLDGDGIDDLILINSTSDISDGLFVLPGSPERGIHGYSSFVATTYPGILEGEPHPFPVAPCGVLAGQFGGGAGPDIVVYGRNNETGGGVLMAYPSPGIVEPAAPPIVNQLDPAYPAPGWEATEPAFFAEGAYGGSGATDLVVGHEEGFFRFSVAALDDSFRLAPVHPIDAPADGYPPLRAAAFSPGAEAGFDDLVVSTQSAVYLLRNQGGEAAPIIYAHELTSLEEGHHHVGFAQLNPGADADAGVELVDVIGVGASQMYAKTLAIDETGGGDYALSDGGGEGQIPDAVAVEDLLVLDVDGGAPDVVVLESQEDGPGFVRFYANLAIDGEDLVPEAHPSAELDWYLARFMAAGDFDGDGVTELLAFQADGYSICLELGPTSVVPCTAL